MFHESAMDADDWNLSSLQFEDFDAGFELTDAFDVSFDLPDGLEDAFEPKADVDSLDALLAQFETHQHLLPSELSLEATVEICQKVVRLDHDYCSNDPKRKTNFSRPVAPEKARKLQRNAPTHPKSVQNCDIKRKPVSLLKPVSPTQKVAAIVQSPARSNENIHSTVSPDQKKPNVKTKKLQSAESMSVKNVILLKNGTEQFVQIGQGKCNRSLKERNEKTNFLLNDSVKNYDPARMFSFKLENDDVTNNHKNILKSFVRDGSKAVSLLRSNYSNEVLSKLDTLSGGKNDSDELSKLKVLKDNAKINEKMSVNDSKSKILPEKNSNLNENGSCKRLETAKLKNSPNKKSTCENSISKKLENGNSVTSQRLSGTIKTSKISNSTDNHKKNVFDPISEATKKALKLKALSMKKNNIDEIVMSKIPKVNNLLILPMVTENGKLLPMIKEANNDTCIDQNQPRELKRRNSLYEEIVMVSIGVDTRDMNNKGDISNKNVKNNSNCESKQKSEHEHGEDKVILHLTKDRIRPAAMSVSIQTDFIIKKNVSSDNKRVQPQQNREETSIPDNVDKNYYNELINRWKSDAAKMETSIRSGNLKYRSDVSVRSLSPKLDRESREKGRDSKFDKRCNRSCSREETKFDSGESNGTAVQSTDGYFSDNDASVKSLPLKSKRKRNVSNSSDELNCGRNPRNVSRHKKKTWKEHRNMSDDATEVAECSGRSRSSSLSSMSSVSSDSSSSSSSSYTDGYNSSSSRRSREKSPSRTRRFKYTQNYHPSRDYDLVPRNKKRTQEERKIIYVGMLEPCISVSELKMKFIKYGQVENVKIHTKDNGMRYGFVTFAEAKQSYRALENAASDPNISHYDVFFGGRRSFCRQVYEDLDELEAMQEESAYYPSIVSRNMTTKSDSTFDDLLKQAKSVLSHRKTKQHKYYTMHFK